MAGHPAEGLGLHPVRQGPFLGVFSRAAVRTPELCSRTVHEPGVEWSITLPACALACHGHATKAGTVQEAGGSPRETTFKDVEGGTSLAVQWSRFCTASAGGSGSTPGRET